MKAFWLPALLALALFTGCSEIEPVMDDINEGTSLDIDKTAAAVTLTAFQQDMLNRVNALRKSGCTCGTTYMKPVPALTWNTQVAAAAERHVNDMATKKFFSHTGSDGSTVATRLTATGYKWRNVGENIAYGYTSAAAVMSGWQKSAGHCKNMMSPNFTHFGAAMKNYYWGQVFARPM